MYVLIIYLVMAFTISIVGFIGCSLWDMYEGKYLHHGHATFGQILTVVLFTSFLWPVILPVSILVAFYYLLGVGSKRLFNYLESVLTKKDK